MDSAISADSGSRTHDNRSVMRDGQPRPKDIRGNGEAILHTDSVIPDFSEQHIEFTNSMIAAVDCIFRLS